MPGRPRIFLSHTSRDKQFVRELAQDLEAHGVGVWLDEAEIKVGDSLIEKISEGIGNVEYLGVVLSPRSVESAWVREELNVALTEKIGGRRLKVLPILLEPCQLPAFLKDKFYADFTGAAKPRSDALSLLLQAMGVSSQASMVNSSAEILATLTAARSERSAAKCIELLKTALHMSEEWANHGGGISARILKANALAELAIEEATPKSRTTRWEASLEVLRTGIRDCSSPKLVEEYALVAVDCFQDQHCSLGQAERQQLLREVLHRLNEAMTPTLNRKMVTALLIRKSSVLRHLSLSDFAEKARVNRLQESMRCAERAVAEGKDSSSLIELGLSEWALARHETTDERYVQRLKKAETHLTDDLLKEIEPARLALARLYRMTFRPFDSCECFSHIVHSTKNIRRLLRDAYIFGEAAIQLWHADYPEAVTARYVSEALELIEVAVAAGYENARLFSPTYIDPVLA